MAKITYEEAKVIDTIMDFLGDNETVQIYLETKMEEFGFDFDPDGALTDAESNAWANAQTIVMTKLLAKVMDVL